MKTDNKYLFIVLLIFFISACSNSNSKLCHVETPHPRSFDLVDGSLFHLELLNEVESLRFSEEIHMRVVNTSNNIIWFHNDLNLVVMNRTSNNSIHIFPILSDSFSDDPVILDKSGSTNDSYDFSFSPHIVPVPNSLELEVFISGYILEEGKICEGQYRAMNPIILIPDD